MAEILVAIVKLGAILALALLIAALWLGVGLWTIPVVVAVGAALVAGMYLIRRERELKRYEAEIMREESEQTFEQTAREISDVREAWSRPPSRDKAPGPDGRSIYHPR